MKKSKKFFEGTIEQYIKKMGIGKANKIRLSKTRAYYDFYYEDKEKYYVNKVDDDTSTWVVAPEFKGWIEYLIAIGFKMEEI